mgnify:CR=1 FL=1
MRSFPKDIEFVNPSDKGTGDSSKTNPNKIKLTPEREKYYRMKIDEAKARVREEEIKGRKALGEHLNRTLEDNNSGKVVTYTSSEGHLTRPDSIGRNAKDEIDLVHDHKHKISDKDTVGYIVIEKKSGFMYILLNTKKYSHIIIFIHSFFHRPPPGKRELPSHL